MTRIQHRPLAMPLLCVTVIVVVVAILCSMNNVNAIRMSSLTQLRTSNGPTSPTSSTSPTTSSQLTKQDLNPKLVAVVTPTSEEKSLFDPKIDWFTVVACCISKDAKFTKTSAGLEYTKCGDKSICKSVDPTMLKHIAHASTLPKYRPNPKSKTNQHPIIDFPYLSSEATEKQVLAKLEQIKKTLGSGGGKGSMGGSPPLVAKTSTTINSKDFYSASQNRPQPIIPSIVGSHAQSAGAAFVEHESEADVTTDEAATSSDETTLAEIESGPYTPGTSWPNGHVLYSWSDQIMNLPNNIAGAIIFSYTEGIAEWASNTCIDFVQRPAGAGVVSFSIKHTLGSSSTLGGSGTAATAIEIGVGIQMGPGRWPWSDDIMVGVQMRPDVVHETGHVIGFLHEFGREDRNTYVHIDTSVATGCSLARCTNTNLANEYTTPCNPIVAQLVDPAVFAQIAQAVPVNPLAPTTQEAFGLHFARLYGVTHNPTQAQLMETCKQALCQPRVDNAYRRDVGKELYTRYDYSSVMHYSFDTCMRAVAPPPYPVPHGMPGSDHISPLDIEAACQIYHCGVNVVVHGAARLPGAGHGAATQTFTYSRYVKGHLTVAHARAQLIDFLTADPLGRVAAAYTKADVLAQLALPWNADVAHPDLLNTQRLDAAPHGLTGAVGARTLTVYLLDAASCVHYNCIKVTISGKSQPKVQPPSSVTKGYPTPDSSYTMTAIIFRGAQTVADVRQAFIAAVATDPALAPVVLDSITHALRNGDIKHNGQALQPTQTLSAVGAFGGGHGPFTLALTTEFTIYSHRFVQADLDE